MNNEERIAQPIPVWKLTLLFLATAGLYQFVWLYRTTGSLAAVRKLPLSPLSWAALPLLGPLAAIPAYFLACHVRQWQEDSRAEIGHLAEPVFVALILAVAYVPLIFLVINSASLASFAAVAVLASCVAYLALQGQINLNISRDQPSSIAERFAGREIATVAVGALLAVPLYAFTFTNVWMNRGAATLAVGDIVAREGDFFRLHVNEVDWRRIEPGGLAEESSLEFLGPDEETWAIVFDSTGLDVDSVLAFREEAVHSEYRGASCRQSKTLVPESLTVRGTIECTGRNVILGDYIFLAHVLSDRSGVAEIVGSTASPDSSTFQGRLPGLRRFLDGLEFVP